MTKLKIATDLSLPLEAVTQTIAILAKRRSGKSYAMRRLVEQLFRAGQQVVLVDPKGDQWGVRSSADGKAPGLPIVILGGERGDVPLEPGSGEVVAKLVVEERVSVLLDLSMFRKHEVATFMTAFMENLYRLKAREIYRTPMMLVIDEADAIAPQKPQKGEERMLGAAEDIVRRGGQRGIGCVLVTQRSAVLNKNVLTQAQMLVALRTIAPQDLAAMNAWIDVHGTPEQRKTLMESLPSLPVGDAWFWSPGWPTTDGIFKRTHVLPIETFDSGKSPEPGVKPVEPKNLADVDLDALKGQMAATIEKAKADNPIRLRARIVELEHELKKGSRAPSGHASKADLDAEFDRGRAAGRRDADEEYSGGFTAGVAAARAKIETDLPAALVAAIGGSLRALKAPKRERSAVPERPQRQVTAAPAVARAAPAQRPNHAGPPSEGLTGPQQRVLDALAWWDSIGVQQPDKGQVGFIAGYRVGKNVGGTFGNILGQLRADGLIHYPSTGSASLTPAGFKIARRPFETPSTEALQRAIRDRLDGPESRVLDVLIEAYPNELTKQECGARSNYTVGENVGGTFGNILGRLRSLGLIDYPSTGKVVALPVLFLAS
jgi:uncharacterized protein